MTHFGSKFAVACAALVLIAMAFAAAAIGRPANGAATLYVVNSTADDDDGTCADSPGDCTLREAIVAANATTGALIWFDLTGCPGASCTIMTTGGLPALTGDGAYIDGTTQAGYSGHALIELDGGLQDPNLVGPGISLLGDHTGVQALRIRRFQIGVNADSELREGRMIVDNVISDNSGNGVQVMGNNSVVQGNVIEDNGGTGVADNFADGGSGLLVKDNQILRNGRVGVQSGMEMAVVTGNRVEGNGDIGIYAVADNSATEVTGNTVLGNDRTGMQVSGLGLVVTGNDVEGNGEDGVSVSSREGKAGLVANNTVADNGAIALANGDEAAGVSVSGTLSMHSNTVTGNAQYGVYADGEAVNIGADGANTISGNGGAGILVDPDATGVTISGNSIFDNGGLGIDLSPVGVTENDPGDGDLGANNLQNFPELTSAVAGSLTISGTLDSRPERDYQIDFYASDECDPSGFGEGTEYLATLLVHTDVDGIAQIEAETNADVAPGNVITATATNLGTGDTSEFSECVAVTVEGGPTPTPGATETPVPTPTPTPGPTQTPGPTGTPGAKNVQGDVDCDGDVDSVDALKQLRHVASLAVAQTEPCTDIGESLGRVGLKSDPPNVGAAGAPPALFGDVDCDGDVDSVDALKVLRHVASLPVQQMEPCADIGT